MIIHFEPHLLTIDFERPEAPWVVLVIDDIWWYSEWMIRGTEDDSETDLGIGDRCLDFDAVSNWWANHSRQAPEPFARALLLLPMIAGKETTIAKIAFAPFPPSIDSSTVESLVAEGQSVAALIDVLKESGARREVGIYFSASWDVLDASAVAPACARALWTRGGGLRDLPSWVQNIPWVNKSSEEREERQHMLSGEFCNWWQSVLGDLEAGATVFRTATNSRPTHDASTLSADASDEIETLLEQKLIKIDGFGVWRWCRFDSVDLALKRKWLAAKSFQTTLPDSTDFSVLALIALVNGIGLMRGQHPYDLNDFISEVTDADIERDFANCLGRVSLANGCYVGDFFRALRTWLVHPEQFVKNNASIEVVTLRRDSENVYICMKYSAPLPSAVLNGSDEADKRKVGSSRGAFLSLISFTDSYAWDSTKAELSIVLRLVSP